MSLLLVVPILPSIVDVLPWSSPFVLIFVAGSDVRLLEMIDCRPPLLGRFPVMVARLHAT